MPCIEMVGKYGMDHIFSKSNLRKTIYPKVEIFMFKIFSVFINHHVYDHLNFRELRVRTIERSCLHEI